MSGRFRNIGVVGVATALSRVLGLARDILFFAYLGAGVWASAFILAFTLPNLFRRLLGEGALTSALIPVFTRVRETDGDTVAFVFFNRLLLKLAVVLGALTFLGGGLFWLLPQVSDTLDPRWRQASGLAIALFPYVVLICLAAIIAAAANVYGRFGASALSPVWLNLAMIGALILGGMMYPERAEAIVWVLVGGVLIGGGLQLALPAVDFMKAGWRLRIRGQIPENTASACQTADRDLWKLLLPGLLGAAILQVNILVSRFLAYSLDEQAAAILYLASRLMELPLGLFTVAVATVTFPALARSVAQSNTGEFATAYLQGQRWVLAISLAAGVGLTLLGREILATLFGYGKFDAAAIDATYPVVAVYGLGLATYSYATLATRGLHAHGRMATVMQIAGLCLVANLVLSVALMRPFGAAGLAAANVLAALLQSILLSRRLKRTAPGTDFRLLLVPILKLALSVGLLAGACLGSRHLLASLGYTTDWLVLLVCIPCAMLAFALGLLLTRFEDWTWVRRRLSRR